MPQGSQGEHTSPHGLHDPQLGAQQFPHEDGAAAKVRFVALSSTSSFSEIQSEVESAEIGFAAVTARGAAPTGRLGDVV